MEPRKFSADTSLSDPKADVLNYARYARHVANAIVTNAPDEGIVFSVHGKWGTGKSTFLQFVKAGIEEFENTAPVLIEFNPWWFSTKESLIRGFFDTLADELAKETDCPWRLIEDFRTLCNLVTTLQLPGQYGRFARLLNWLLSKVRTDVPTIKMQIKRAIERYSKRFVIIMDDVDRLTSDEVVEVIRLIKAIADFPKVTYLLAFDKEEASKAIEKQLGSDGFAYLEKIIQVPIELPMLDQDALSHLFVNSIRSFLNLFPGNFVQSRWNDVYHQGIRKLITKPRDVSRIMNAFKINYPVVMHEVDTVDFVFIETIRVVYPALYEVIRSNQERFTGIEESRGKDQAQKFHDEWLRQFSTEQQDVLKVLLSLIFPRLQSVWDNYYFTYEHVAEWTRDFRICSPEQFPVYFHFGVPSNNISNEQIRALLASTDSPDEFERTLLLMTEGSTPDGVPRSRKVLTKLYDTIQEAPETELRVLVSVVFKVSHELLIRDSQVGFMQVTTEYLISSLLWRAINRISSKQRILLLEDNFDQATSLYVMLSILHNVEELYAKQDKTEVSPDSTEWIDGGLVELRQCVVRRIEEFAHDGRLFDQHRLPYILNQWSRLAADISATRRWVETVTKDDSQLLTYLRKFVTLVHSNTIGSVNVHISERLDLQSVKQFIDLDKIEARINSIAQVKNLSPEDREVIDLFKESLDSSSNLPTV